ncbi:MULTISPECIES: site-specific DNA-methyltransferase [unclassified Neisseria]|uniref:site-specific DNA-methyltransferase n=1 Tax=unclassified Neisseria TaxID=2623750 RepID=UPI0026668B12|nr:MULTISPECIES: site-specific DNA-methyltransferase [unclassified Neisseria]MDO1510543.1 site-specific DNA-methyltransferase [Neisseria sp. MVDL19-042950]MDO1516336.1 site-specific DNA-methyltransferase [Neisseria sp. MVDL18-041461]
MDFDGTNNLFIEAENLEALKILQKAYAGSVKMIYIDPPYNTGSDSFIYPDKFSETREEYARRVGDKDDEGYLKRDGVFQGAWRKNSKESGHYHSNWLSMMLPRLHLAKTLLRDDGVIFISIDDNEQAQLKLLCDEVFGAENFVSQITWHRKRGKDNSAPNLSRVHEYLIAYSKNIQLVQFNKLEIEAETLKAYKNPDNDSRGSYRILGLWARGNQGGSRYEYTTNNGTYYPEREWLVGLDTMKKLDDEKRLIENGDKLYRKLFLSEVAGSVPETIWLDTSNTANAADELKLLFDKKTYFDTPKPIPYLTKMTKLTTTPNDLILDFFSGSGTTAHAVMQLNAEDGGNRRYICVQLPEETDEKSEARKAGFDTIAEIAKERIRRAGKQIREQHPEKTVDTGFKVFKLAESHFKQWRPSENGSDGLEAQLAMFIDPVAEHAEPLNMAYELMLRLGLKPTCSVTHEDDVFWVDDQDTGKRIALLLTRADEHLIDAVIAKQPAKAVALDRLFDGNDALKTNTVLQMQEADIVFMCI